MGMKLSLNEDILCNSLSAFEDQALLTLLENCETVRIQKQTEMIADALDRIDVISLRLGIDGQELLRKYILRSESGEIDINDKRVLKAKYRNPETGESWTGRGKTPLWLEYFIKQGYPKEHFLI